MYMYTHIHIHNTYIYTHIYIYIYIYIHAHTIHLRTWPRCRRAPSPRGPRGRPPSASDICDTNMITTMNLHNTKLTTLILHNTYY